jgi:hypothetical protein
MGRLAWRFEIAAVTITSLAPVAVANAAAVGERIGRLRNPVGVGAIIRGRGPNRRRR